jgi:hypothetical protein
METSEGLGPLRLARDKLLLVEGRSSEVFFLAFLKDLGRLHQLQVVDFGGVNELRPKLKTLKALPGFSGVSTIGLVRDAESNAASAWQSVIGALGACEFVAPPSHASIQGGHPRVGVFILPNGSDPGNLETLCIASVDSRPEMKCVACYHDCLVELAGQLNSVVNLGNTYKLRCHAYLASQPRPGLLVGQAANAGYWPWSSSAFNELSEFLRQL